MKKRVLSLISALILALSPCVAVSAAGCELDLYHSPLRFDENGEFKIMYLCDCQDAYPAYPKMLKYIDAMIRDYKPDLVILGGDNSVSSGATREDAINEIVSIFVRNKVYFSLVFGNHDHETRWTDDGAVPMPPDSEQLKIYQRLGGKYCLAYDPEPALHGDGTHNLPVFSSRGEEIKFNLWLFDSGDSVYDENGKRLGYDCVTTDQIEWYKNASAALETKTGAKVPSLVFQHIVVGEVYDALFRESPVDLGPLTRKFNGKIYSGMPKTENFEGYLGEFPCPGYNNFGELDAMAERGDVLAIFSGHDHVNSYTTEWKGIKLINTAAATYYTYANYFSRGSRMITLNEKDTGSFKTETVEIDRLALEDRAFARDAKISVLEAAAVVYGGKFILGLSKCSARISKFISKYWL